MQTPALDLVESLRDRCGDRRIHFDSRDAADYPWLFEPFRRADLDLDVEKGAITTRSGRLEVDLVSKVLDRRQQDRPVAAFQRAIRGGVALHHSSLTFEPFQRQGIARRVFAASVDLYDSLSMDRVRLNAVNVGRYVWARVGFDFAEHVLGEGEPPALAPLRELAQRLGHDLGAASTPWEIAGRREEIPPGLFEARGGSTRFLGSPTDCEGPLGRVLFLCAGVGDWDGVLDLAADSPGRRQFESYCGPAG